jgi:hypothetical protein
MLIHPELRSLYEFTSFLSASYLVRPETVLFNKSTKYTSHTIQACMDTLDLREKTFELSVHSILRGREVPQTAANVN